MGVPPIDELMNLTTPHLADGCLRATVPVRLCAHKPPSAFAGHAVRRAGTSGPSCRQHQYLPRSPARRHTGRGACHRFHEAAARLPGPLRSLACREDCPTSARTASNWLAKTGYCQSMRAPTHNRSANPATLSGYSRRRLEESPRSLLVCSS
jgi:hypothetical protein